MDFQYKASPGTLDDDRPGRVTAVFATFNTIDRDNDVVLPGAFKDGQRTKMMWGHDWTKWIGDGVIRVTKQEAIFDGEFWLDTTAGAEAYKQVKNAGDLAEWSWGFFIPEGASHVGEHDGKPVRFLGDKPLEVPEVSPVAVGAGINTRTTAIKSETVEQVDTDDADEPSEPIGSMLPFSEHLESVVSDVAEIVTRAQDRAEFRAKEGRRLSRATRTHLTSLQESIALLLHEDEREAAADETDEPKADATGTEQKAAECAPELALLVERFQAQEAYYALATAN